MFHKYTYPSTIFTTEAYNLENNYDYYRGLGDISFQQTVVRYIITNYPEIFNPQRKAIITDLKKYYVKPEIYFEYLQKNIHTSFKNEEEEDITVLFNIFMAMLGYIEQNHGYYEIFQEVSTVLDSFGKIKLSYETLVDPVSILKELGDKNKNKWEIQYVYEKIENDQKENQAKITIIWIKNNITEIISSCITNKKIFSEQIASNQALKYLDSKGIKYEIPEKYQFKKSLFKTEEKMKKPPNQEFKNFILKIFNEATDTYIKENIKEQIIESNWNLFIDAITHQSINIKENYEALETIGDNTLNKIIFWYISNRFPQLNCSNGKELILRIKTSLVQTKNYAELCQNIGLEKFIKPTNSTQNKEAILEDIFEAFFGALEIAIDSILPFGTGLTICSEIIKKILDKKNISLRYEDLVDPITTLKEIFDIESNKKEFGELKYKDVFSDNKKGKQKILSFIKDQKENIIAKSKYFYSTNEAKEATFEVAKKTLKYLSSLGITHFKTEKYDKFL